MNEKNMFFIEHWGVIMSGCMMTILSGYVLQCNNVACAVFMVQVLAIIYCIIWSVIMWKMMRVIKEKEMPDEYHEDVFDLFHFLIHC
jgi:uncharacterized membrane protein